MRRSTKKRGVDKRKKTRRSWKGGVEAASSAPPSALAKPSPIPKKGGPTVKEQIMIHMQNPHSSKWPVIKIYSTITGKYSDLFSKFLGDNIHKIEYAISSIMHYENIFALGLQRSFFQRLVYLGQEYPEQLNEEPKTKEVFASEIEDLKKIHADPHYEKELASWIAWYAKNIILPEKEDHTLITADELMDKLKKETEQGEGGKEIFKEWKTKQHILLEIAKMARISWYKNYKLNRDGFLLGKPIETIAIE